MTDLFRDLPNENTKQIIDVFIRNNPGPVTTAISSFLTAMNNDALRALIERLLDTLTDKVFRSRFMNALKFHIQNHPWQAAFFVIGVILMVNPLAVAGFGSLGPVAGSAAAGWQASFGGTVAAGSAFSILQSMGMLGAVAIPVAGAAIAGSMTIAAAGGNAAGSEVAKWARGEYGEPVKYWWNGNETPVRDWWNGTETPVKNWWEHVTGQRRDHEHQS